MKNIRFILFATLILTGLISYSQSPEKMFYQTVVRNASNELLANQAIGMRISVLQGSMTGSAVYVETQRPTTNSNGLVALEIGGGTAVTGTFAGINWANGPFYVKTEADLTGGTSYSIIGTGQLLSVPYALYAKNGVPSGGTNGQVLTYCNGVAIWTTGGVCP